MRSFAVSYLTRLLSVCLLFLAWTTASICAMETSYLPDFRPSKTLSTSSVTQKLELTPKTTWGSSLWPSRMKIWFSLFVLFTGTNVTKSIDTGDPLCVCCSNCEVLTTLTPDTGRILSKLHAVQPRGVISFCTGIRVAHVSRLYHQFITHIELSLMFLFLNMCFSCIKSTICHLQNITSFLPAWALVFKLLLL